MLNLPSRLMAALQSDCAGDLDEIILAQRRADFESLRELVTTGSGVDPRFRTRAIYALGRWGDAAAVDDILQVMPVLDEQSRLTAIDALGRLGSDKALQAVLESTGDASPHVRQFAIHALGRFTAPVAREKLVAMMENDPDESLRNLAAKYLNPDQSA